MRNFKDFRETTAMAFTNKYPPRTIVLVDADGNDWYDVMESFADNTSAVSYIADGRISGYTVGSPSGTMWPIGCSVLEVAELPEDFKPEDYKVVDFKLVKNPDVKLQEELKAL